MLCDSEFPGATSNPQCIAGQAPAFTMAFTATCGNPPGLGGLSPDINVVDPEVPFSYTGTFPALVGGQGYPIYPEVGPNDSQNPFTHRAFVTVTITE